MLVYDYTFQNVTLMEITCCGSIIKPSGLEVSDKIFHVFHTNAHSH